MGELVRKRRKELGFSQPNLARLVGAHVQTLNKIEAGEIKFSKYFYRLETVLGISIVPKAQGNIAQLPNYVSSMVIDAEDLGSVALTETLSAQGASQQWGARQEDSLDEDRIFHGEIRSGHLGIRDNLDSCSVLDL